MIQNCIFHDPVQNNKIPFIWIKTLESAHQQAPPRGSEAGAVQITPCEIFLGQESLVID